jgi:putative aldouronate transport system substrate-binding protein
MNHSKKSWLGIVSWGLAFSLVASACSNGGGSSTQSSTDQPAATSDTKTDTKDNAGTAEAPITITWANDFNSPEADNNDVQKEIEKKFNVKITNVKLDRSTWRDKFNVLLVSGEIPDIFPIDADTNDMANWADQGIIASISKDELETNMPNYAQHLNAIDPGAWAIGLYNGKNYGIPKVWPPGNDGFLPGFNGDWLKKIGYTEPPKTLDELHAVFTKFVNNDPDGDGKKDTYALTARGKLPIQMFTSIFSAYGVSPYWFKLGDDGKVVYGGITEETRAALKTLSQWYKEGLIDPEFITNNNDEINKAFVDQKIGYVDNGGWGYLYKESGYITKPAADKGISVVPGVPITGPAGKPYAFSYGAEQAPVLLGVQLEKDDKKRQKIEQILDWVSTNEEGWLLTNFGKKDVNYTLQDGAVVPSTDPANAAAKVGAGAFYNPLAWIDMDFMKYRMSKDQTDFGAKINKGYTPLQDLVQAATLKSRAQYGANLQTLQDTYLIKAVTGQANTDSDFDSFKAQWLSSGGQAVTDEVAQVYAARQSLK